MKRLTNVLTAGGSSYFGNIMPNPDVLFGKGGVRMSVFDEMLQDAHIYAKLEQLKDTVLSMQWDVKPADGESAEQALFIKGCLGRLGVAGMLQDILTAVEYGFSVTEIVWELKDGNWIPVKSLARRADRFGFSPEGRLTLADGNTASVLEEQYKFIVHRNSPKDENPYGTPVLSKCYWPWMFKKAGFRYWLTVAEKYGVPTVLALFESSDDDESQTRARELAENLYNIQNDAAVALANVDSVQVLETKGSSADFASLVHVCNTEISKAVTGEVLTSDTGSNGSYSLAVQHQQTLERKGRKIARAAAETITATLVSWIWELNFEGGCRAEFILSSQAEASWDVVREAKEMGMEIDLDEVARRFGIPLA